MDDPVDMQFVTAAAAVADPAAAALTRVNGVVAPAAARGPYYWRDFVAARPVPVWQVVVSVLAAATGVGLLLAGYGAAVMWLFGWRP